MITREELCRALVDAGIDAILIDEVRSDVYTRGSAYFDLEQLVDRACTDQLDAIKIMMGYLVGDFKVELQCTKKTKIELYSIELMRSIDNETFKPLGYFSMRFALK